MFTSLDTRPCNYYVQKTRDLLDKLRGCTRRFRYLTHPVFLLLKLQGIYILYNEQTNLYTLTIICVTCLHAMSNNLLQQSYKRRRSKLKNCKTYLLDRYGLDQDIKFIYQ